MGPFHLARFAIEHLKATRGRIVNVSSGAANVALAAAGAYCAAKAALTHLTRVLALEEPRVTSVSVRPGVVDTRMQDILRNEGPRVMPAEQAGYYVDLKHQGELEPAEIPGRAIAWLALHAPPAWSGEFLNYDDPRIVTQAKTVLGDSYLP
jgi:NAD(P)-dependent dehydrogenase (short-subunit alcohol dehydrogenase family)